MTKEESIKVLIQYIDYDAETPDYYEMEKACKVAIKALEQDSCEDCISRKQAMKACYQMAVRTGIEEMPYKYAETELAHLPSIQPKPKTGHWIYREDMLDYECSECGRVIETHRFENPYIRYPYCHCGAKMVEQQESEE